MTLFVGSVNVRRKADGNPRNGALDNDSVPHLILRFRQTGPSKSRIAQLHPAQLWVSAVRSASMVRLCPVPARFDRSRFLPVSSAILRCAPDAPSIPRLP